MTKVRYNLLSGQGFSKDGTVFLGVYCAEGTTPANAHVEDWHVDGANKSLPTIIVACAKCQARVVAVQCAQRGRAWCDHGEWTEEAQA